MIVDNTFDESKVKAFEQEHGLGPDRNRFSTNELALQYSDLLKDLFGVYYNFIEMRKDEHGYYPEYSPIE
ncbi:MAG TPA: hypothetical protein VGQ59_15300 [Cyclobacteriaceae bacterium]|jgi:hypothetical protein|nr:hypothetical protein [Cyclobacteriaceae bacterium]